MPELVVTATFAPFELPSQEDSSLVLRIAPLLRCVGEGDDRVIAVGQVRLIASSENAVEIVVDIEHAWHFTTTSFEPLTSADALTNATEVIRSELAFANITRPTADELVARAAKDVAEKSRNAVKRLREIRYGLETDLAEASAGGAKRHTQIDVVAALLQLNVITSRAADVARESVREGMWLWVRSVDAYRGYRRAQDPTIIAPPSEKKLKHYEWMPVHDAGVRQCLEMRKQLDAESTAVQSLLAAASSVSSARDAEAQSNFNVLAGVASLGLGIPALVLSLYGADRLVPFVNDKQWLAFLPVALSMSVAAVIAIVRAPQGRQRKVWILGAVSLLVVMVLLLVYAGTIAPN